MSTPQPARPQYTFGRFRLAADATLLLDGDVRVRLAPKVLRTLLVLVQRAGQVVTKDELMAQVWPGVFVEETGLTRNISVLRRALGDDGERAIVTVPRIGYRFSSAVSFVQEPMRAAGERESPFVGREAELRHLDEALERAWQGRGALVALAGEPGIGKTTLADKLIGAARGRWLTALGRCSELFGTAEPHLPVLEALDMLAACAPVGETLRRLAPTWAAHLNATRAESPSAPADTPERLLRELTRFLSEAASDRPLLIVLEDLHWADAATTDVVTHLASRIRDMRVLMLVTYRDREMPAAASPFSQARAELRARGLLREIALPLLTAQEVMHFVEEAAPAGVPVSDLGMRVYAGSEGNPLFMTTLLAYLADAGGQPGSSTLAPVPESLRGLITRALARLDDTQRSVLEAAALQGYRFDVATVALSLDRPVLDIEDVLQTLEREHGLIDDGRPHGQFRHALYQAGLLDQMPPTRGVVLAGRVANALLARSDDHGTSVAGQVAFLLERAREEGRAAEYFAVASRRATERLAFRDAHDLAGRGMRCLERASELTGRERTRIECALCFASLIPLSSWRGYGHPEVEALAERVSRLAHELGDPEATARALGMTVFLRLIRGACTAARDAARELAALAESAGHPALLVNAHMQAQLSCHHLGHFADADAHAVRVIGIGQTLSPAERFINIFDPVVASLAESSRNAWITGRLATAAALADRAVAVAGEVGNAESLAFAWLFHAWLHGYRGDWRACLASSATGIEIATRNGTVQTLAWNRCVHGWARAHQGDVGGGRDELAAGTRLSQSIMGEVALPQFRAMMAEVLMLAGDRDGARGCITQALAARDSQDDDYFAAEIHRLAACCDAPGPHGFSRERHLDAAFAIARSQGAAFFTLRTALTSRQIRGDDAALRAALAAVSEPEPWADIVAAGSLV